MIIGILDLKLFFYEITSSKKHDNFVVGWKSCLKQCLMCASYSFHGFGEVNIWPMETVCLNFLKSCNVNKIIEKQAKQKLIKINNCEIQYFPPNSFILITIPKQMKKVFFLFWKSIKDLE